MSRPRSYITVVTEDRRPAVVRVRIVGECGDWRAVQPSRRDDCDFEITLHRRYVYGSWMEAWKRAKASARRPITGGKDRRAIFDFGRVPGTGSLPPGSTVAITPALDVGGIALRMDKRCATHALTECSDDATGDAEARKAAGSAERRARFRTTENTENIYDSAAKNAKDAKIARQIRRAAKFRKGKWRK